MEWLTDPTIWVGLLTLVVLEIILGIDNLIFIAILADKAPPFTGQVLEILKLIPDHTPCVAQALITALPEQGSSSLERGSFGRIARGGSLSRFHGVSKSIFCRIP